MNIRSALMKNETLYSGAMKVSERLFNETAYVYASRLVHTAYRVYSLLKYRYADFFWGVNIEISTFCNRRCSYCPNSIYGTPREFMDEKVFKKVIEDLKRINYSGSVAYEFYGEPLLDKRLVDFVRYTRAQLPKSTYLKVLSNGDALTMDVMRDLIEAGLQEVAVTIHDLEPEKMMRKLQPIIEKYPSHLRVKSNYQSKYLSDRGGAINIPGGKKMKRCFYSGKVIIDYRGDVLLCCNDYFHSHKFGNVTDETVVSIWKKREFARIRREARRGRPTTDICRQCLDTADSQ